MWYLITEVLQSLEKGQLIVLTGSAQSQTEDIDRDIPTARRVYSSCFTQTNQEKQVWKGC